MNLTALEDAIHRMPDALRRAVIAEMRPRAHIEADIESAQNRAAPLAGISCFFKDNFDVAGLPTRASSRFLERVRPGPHQDAALVRHARELGLAVVGKTQMNEFAYGLDGDNAHFGACPHPTRLGRCAGGSSSGSAWVVARGLVPIAFGTDTGGSIRVPAAFCGLFGLRLPPGSWALDGCIPLAPSFDAAGWFTANATDMARFTKALLDLTSPTGPANLRVAHSVLDHPDFTPALHATFPDASPVRMFHDPAEAAALVDAFNILQSTEAMAVHRDWIDRHAGEYDPAVRARILRARNWSAAQRDDAALREQKWRERIDGLFQQHDVIVLPVSLTTAPALPMSDATRTALLAQTVAASLGRLAVLTLPIATPDGPLGIQCLLPPGRWRKVLAALVVGFAEHEA